MLSAFAAPTTVKIYSGFGGAARYDDLKSCRLVEQLDEGRAPSSTGLNWTHYIDLDFEVDIRDNVSRSVGSNSLTYSDGDEVRIPDVQGTKYVVVFVVPMGMGTNNHYKRAYLLRDDPVWDGTGW